MQRECSQKFSPEPSQQGPTLAAPSSALSHGGERVPGNDRRRVLMHAVLTLSDGVGLDSAGAALREQGGSAAHLKGGLGFHPMLCATDDGEMPELPRAEVERCDTTCLSSRRSEVINERELVTVAEGPQQLQPAATASR